MKLFREITEEIHIIKEGSGDAKTYFIEGIFLQGNIRNRNRRMYPMDVLENEVNRYTSELIDKNRAYGELGHPEGPQINLERASHLIQRLARENNNYIGKAKVLGTPYGNIVKNLLDEGAQLGVSSRGLGTLEERNGTNVVGSDFMLATAADIVADPSAPEAFVRGIMEDAEWVYLAGKGWTPRSVETVKNTIKKTSSKNLLDESVKAFKTFIDSL